MVKHWGSIPPPSSTNLIKRKLMKNKLNKHIVNIDVSALAYMLMYSIGTAGLSHNGKDTGIIFGFLNQLRFLNNIMKPTTTIFSFDNPMSKRRELFPEYKEKRRKKKKDDPIVSEMIRTTIKQMNVLQNKILPYLGFKNLFCVEGYEADDIMHSIAQSYPSTRMTLITGDEDMYQTLSDTISIFSPRKKQFYTKTDLFNEYGIVPEQWGMIKATAGCKTDEIPGIIGVAEKTAAKYILGKLNPNSKTYKNIEAEAGKDIIERNKPLVILPFKDTPLFTVVDNKFNQQKLKKVAEHLGFASILQTWDEWYLK